MSIKSVEARRQTLSEVDRKARVPFRTKLTALAAILVIIPLSAVGVLVLQQAYDTVDRLNRNFRAQVVERIGIQLESELRAAQDGLETVARTITDTNVPEEAAEPFAVHLVGGQETLDHVAIYSANGALVTTIREPAAEALSMPAELPLTVRAEAEGAGAGTGDVLAAPPAAPRILLAVPLRVGDTTTGYAASYVSLERVQGIITDMAQEDLFGDGVIVATDDYRVLLHLDAARAARAERSEVLAELLSGHQFSSDNDATTVMPFDIDGEPVQSTVSWLHLRRLIVIVQVPEAHALAAVHNIRDVILGVVFVAICIALLAAFVVAKQVTRPIEALSDFAEDLANRRFDKRVTLTTQDEFGVLGDVMSAAAADLQASEERIRQEEAIRGDLGRYLPSEIVEKVVRREQDMGLGGRRQEISVLFADIVAFTPMTDQLSAEEIVALLNELFTLLTEIVFRHGGIIDKFIGDCVMAVFGAPEQLTDHAERAVAAAEDMLRFLEVGNEGWKQKHGVTIELAIGINSGEAIVGNVGSESRMEYTAIGDTVNVAARLEAIARPQQILVTRSTREQIDDLYTFVDLGAREMTGRADPVHVFEVRL